MTSPNPQDPDSPLYDFIDTQPTSPLPNNPDSSLSHFTVRQFAPDGIANTLPIIVTKTAHGLQNGQAIRATQFVVFPILNATGMEQLNNNQYFVQFSQPNSFQLYDVRGLPADGRSFTPFVQGGQFTVSGPLVVNPSVFPPAGVPNPFS